MRTTAIVLAVCLALSAAGLVAEAQTTCDHLQPCLVDCPTDDSDRPCQLGSDLERALAALGPLLP